LIISDGYATDASGNINGWLDTSSNITVSPPDVRTITVNAGSGISTEEHDWLEDNNANILAMMSDLSTQLKILQNKMVLDPDDGKAKLYDDDDTLLLEAPAYSDVDGNVPYDGTADPVRRDRLVSP